MTTALTRFLLASLLAVSAVTTAWAQPTTARFRGIVDWAEADRIQIRRPGGSTLTLRMNPRTRVFAVTEAALRNIKPESYVSVLATPGAEPLRAKAVTLYSPSERGFEAGTQPWDTDPGATFTAGWVADLRGGRPLRLTLGFGGGQASFEIPAGTPVTAIAPGEKALLEPGAAVTLFTQSGPDGALSVGTIAVGRQGAVPSF
ncbi:hypothetical protein MKL09_15015 [Methylobacterium sp. J-048]|uniref:hypothetical protein n=1 Tax=Methylobacterium sp. J-048 TaxID=2836635 RepID=UPI001FBAA390|nr:hypothetical protein [Methylobacterium sp. J-048]MCJ2057863.1 hypothetical protein [Methylobacterium sp. J-048]